MLRTLRALPYESVPCDVSASCSVDGMRARSCCFHRVLLSSIPHACLRFRVLYACVWHTTCFVVTAAIRLPYLLGKSPRPSGTIKLLVFLAKHVACPENTRLHGAVCCRFLRCATLHINEGCSHFTSGRCFILIRSLDKEGSHCQELRAADDDGLPPSAFRRGTCVCVFCRFVVPLFPPSCCPRGAQACEEGVTIVHSWGTHAGPTRHQATGSNTTLKRSTQRCSFVREEEWTSRRARPLRQDVGSTVRFECAVRDDKRCAWREVVLEIDVVVVLLLSDACFYKSASKF